MSKNELQQELKAKIKLGIKPSDLKKKTMPKSADNYTEKLETEKADLLIKLTNYEKEQIIAVNTFKHQEKQLIEKEQELGQKDQLITEKEAAIEKLKTRIQELAEKVKEFKKLKLTPDQETTEISTQTSGKSLTELEEEILERRVQNVKDFGTYQDKLTDKENEITKLTHQLTLYQTKINQLRTENNSHQKKVLVLIVLLTIAVSLLLFK